MSLIYRVLPIIETLNKNEQGPVFMFSGNQIFLQQLRNELKPEKLRKCF